MLSKEIGIKSKELENLKQFEFILKSSDKPPKKIKTKALLKYSIFRINLRNYLSFKKRILHKYYKKIEPLDTTILMNFKNNEKPKYPL